MALQQYQESQAKRLSPDPVTDELAATFINPFPQINPIFGIIDEIPPPPALTEAAAPPDHADDQVHQPFGDGVGDDSGGVAFNFDEFLNLDIFLNHGSTATQMDNPPAPMVPTIGNNGATSVPLATGVASDSPVSMPFVFDPVDPVAMNVPTAHAEAELPRSEYHSTHLAFTKPVGLGKRARSKAIQEQQFTNLDHPWAPYPDKAVCAF